MAISPEEVYKKSKDEALEYIKLLDAELVTLSTGVSPNWFTMEAPEGLKSNFLFWINQEYTNAGWASVRADFYNAPNIKLIFKWNHDAPGI